jgi:hypothetical protein
MYTQAIKQSSKKKNVSSFRSKVGKAVEQAMSEDDGLQLGWASAPVKSRADEIKEQLDKIQEMQATVLENARQRVESEGPTRGTKRAAAGVPIDTAAAMAHIMSEEHQSWYDPDTKMTSSDVQHQTKMHSKDHVLVQLPDGTWKEVPRKEVSKYENACLEEYRQEDETRRLRRKRAALLRKKAERPPPPPPVELPPDPKLLEYIDKRDKMAAHRREQMKDGMCDWCGKTLRIKDIPYHQEDDCLERERACPNKDRGCEEWVPVKLMAAHIANDCIVTKQRNALADKATNQREHMFCRNGCGLKMPRNALRNHEELECSNRLMKCRWHTHGCKVMVRPMNRRRHEYVDDLADPRSCIEMTGRSCQIELRGKDLMPPWTAEFWVWRAELEEDTRNKVECAREYFKTRQACQILHTGYKASVDVAAQKMKDAGRDKELREEAVVQLTAVAEVKVANETKMKVATQGIELMCKAAMRCLDIMFAKCPTGKVEGYRWPDFIEEAPVSAIEEVANPKKKEKKHKKEKKEPEPNAVETTAEVVVAAEGAELEVMFSTSAAYV